MPRQESKAIGRYQDFAVIGGPAHCRERITALRAELARLGLTGFIVPRADEHQNEYVPASAERLLWLTGFSGSAGLAIVLSDRAALFVDGRYTVQAAEQVDAAVIDSVRLADATPTDWLERTLKTGDRVGFDPWLFTPDSVDRFSKACAKAGATFLPAANNPIDAIWPDRPAAPVGAVTMRPMKLAGEASRDKVARVQERIEAAGALIVSDAHNVAWLLNIRGADVAHTPLPLSFALVRKSGRPLLFIDSRKISTSVRKPLAAVCEIEDPAALMSSLERLGRNQASVMFDAATCPSALVSALEGAGGIAIVEPDPISLMKARKNAVELRGAEAAHLRDGAAMARFLAWFDREAPGGALTEISAASMLETFRRETGELKDISFPTISAAGPHAALPHYRVSEATDRKIEKGLFLVDSGGQYVDGTTDITRTIAVGAPTREMRDRFTRVLKGHIAIASVVFPRGATGAQIDALARVALWQAGLDFDHGVGHGVGSYLSVHEGPPRIGKTGGIALDPGMIISNEPGYYAAGRFGIRIENLVAVEARDVPGGEREMLGFKTISFAPIDRRAIETRLLSPFEIAWLNSYHANVRRQLSPLVDSATKAWLTKATRKI